MTNLVILEFEAKMSGKRRDDYVLLSNKQSMDETGVFRTATWHRVKDLMPPADLEGEMADFMRARWEFLEPHYEAWKAGEEISETGTPIGSWPGVTKSQIEICRIMKIGTVEALVESVDLLAKRMPRKDAEALVRQGSMFLEAQERSDDLAVISAQKDQIDALMAEVAEMKAEMTKPKRAASKAA